MYNILTLNKISNIGLNQFNNNYNCSQKIENPDAIIVRSSSMHEFNFNKDLLAIARAGIGVNNIPIKKCSDNGIVVFNTPGANANAVKELVLSGLILSSRNLISAIEWTKSLKDQENISKLIEKGKSKFKGPELIGKKIGVIGLGSIGVLVANSALCLGMKVFGYDPYISIDAAWGLSKNVKHVLSLDEIFKNCDYITLHIPLNDNTKNIINSDSISKMKNSVRILNFSREEIVNSSDIKNALTKNKIASYVTDFPTEELIDVKNTICIPHLGASTKESEDNCAMMAVRELIEYIENGNIINSINMPSLSMKREGNQRICVIHKNIPNMISSISGILSLNNINIENMLSKSKNEYAYSIFDTSDNIDKTTIDKINSTNNIIKIRVIE